MLEINCATIRFSRSFTLCSRLPDILSISSMNKIEGEFSSTSLKISLIFCSDSPDRDETNSGPEIL